MEPIKVLIVEDSFFMRKAIEKILDIPQIQVVGLAQNGKEAVEKALALSPDIITMDIEMPVMNGIDAIKIIMEKNPTSVIMLSSLTAEGADSTIEALSQGAVDFITKKAAFTEIGNMKDEIIGKILEVGKINLHNISNFRLKNLEQQIGISQEELNASIANANRPLFNDIDIIAIGISTGGPNALQEAIKPLPANFPYPIIVAQHMPPMFTKSLAQRLKSNSKIQVKEAEDDEKFKAGVVYLAPGGKQLILQSKFRFKITDEPASSIYKPSVNVMVSSLADYYGNRCLGLMMTGMGTDGTEGFIKLKKSGAYIIAQTADTCIASGMVNSISKAGIVDETVPLNRIGDVLCSIANVKRI